jgi:hypothetical protein
MTDEIPRCTATSSQSGERCQKRPIVGGTVCYTHGGATPQVRAKAAERVLEAQVSREIGRQGWEPVGNPVEAYADNAGEVLAFKDRLRERVELLDDWTMRIAAFGGGEGEEGEGRQLMAMGEQVRAYVAAYERALDRAERTLARMIGLGLDAKLIELRADAYRQASASRLYDVITKVLGDLGLTPEQQGLVPGSVARHLRDAAQIETGAAS